MTDASLTHDSTGRLFKYDPRTQRVTVLMSGLAGAGGPAVSSDRKYILVPDYINKKIQRYWLQGPKRGTNEVFMTNYGSPNNIKRAINDGEFWVVVEKKAQGLRINGYAMVLQTGYVSWTNLAE
ncbi:putative strictosidine synthase transcription factor WD40-like family [Helianthus annuus]|nr:putative strictosidine synthase transcription factor WD40-like family [Helianthus annuus]